MTRKVYYIILFLFILCFKVQSQNCPCFLFDASTIDQSKEIKTNFHSLKQTQKIIHDTLATDLFLVIKDFETDQPLIGAQIFLGGSKINKVTDSAGHANFIAFGTGGNYQILISYTNYHCLEIDNIGFKSGEGRWLEIKLKKAN